MKKAFKWFTLLEMLITMVIIGILAVVLTEAYITIWRIALKVEQEKNISEESLLLTQVLQSIADEATIDFDKYNELAKNKKHSSLSENDWFTDTLYLTWGQRSGTEIETTWNCIWINNVIELDENWNYENIQDYSDCKLIIKQNDNTIPITSDKVIISQVQFRVIPYDSDENYFMNSKDDGTIINNLHQPAFWIFVHLYAPLYQPYWTNQIEQFLQLFFNLNV